LSESGGNLTLQVATDGASGTDILRSSGKTNLLVTRSSDLILGNRTLTDITKELLIESTLSASNAIPLRIKSLKFLETLLGKRGSSLLRGSELRPSLFGS